MGSRTPRAPEGLNESGKTLWKSIAREYSLRPDERRILEDACREADLIADLEEVRKAEDFKVVVEGSMGQPVTNPVVAELRQHRGVLARLLGALKFTDESGGSNAGDRPATKTSSSARAAAAKRWGTGGT